jgi:hypothetical protein
MRVRADQAELERRDRPPPSPAPVRPEAARLLALQASAGNAAVAQIDTAIEALTARGIMRDKPVKKAPAPTSPAPVGPKL